MPKSPKDRPSNQSAENQAKHIRQLAEEGRQVRADILERHREGLKIVEQMHRTLREIRDVNKLDSR
jgi:hypothetical protein